MSSWGTDAAPASAGFPAVTIIAALVNPTGPGARTRQRPSQRGQRYQRRGPPKYMRVDSGRQLSPRLLRRRCVRVALSKHAGQLVARYDSRAAQQFPVAAQSESLWEVGT
jgi:hypothetical protein